MLDRIDRLDTFKYIFDRIVDRILPCFERKAFVSHILKRDYFTFDILLRQFFTRNVFIFEMIRAIYTAVNTIVGQIERRKHNDASAVEFFFDLTCQLEHFLIEVIKLTFKKYSCFAMRNAFAFSCFFDDRFDQFTIRFIFLRIGDRF